MDKSLVLFVLGLIMVGLGLLALIIDPPRTHIYSESELIPYVTFKRCLQGGITKQCTIR